MDLQIALASEVLPNPWDVLDEQVALGQDADERGPHHVVLAMKSLGHIGHQALEHPAEERYVGPAGMRPLLGLPRARYRARCAHDVTSVAP